MTSAATRYQITEETDGTKVLAVVGDWTIWTIGPVAPALRKLELPDDTTLDVRDLGDLDTSGAYVIDRALRGEDGEAIPVRLKGEHPTARDLVMQVREATPMYPPHPAHYPGMIAMLDRAGHGAVDAWKELLGILSFIGEAMATLAGLIARPRKIRWTSVVSVMEEAGLDALPIVCFLSFFIGLVIAFLGANMLAQFGAAVFTVEMVGLLMLREFGAVITAILLAGRTDSAFTAQIGAMKMRQEVDAMRVMGLDPMEALVAPRLIALIVMTPLLTFVATLSGIAGGLIAAWLAMDISPSMFISRFQEVIPLQHFWAGMAKTPVFAIVVALVGCRHGLQVGGDVTSLGRHTTSSVVQAIFLVILIDAIFAIVYYQMGV